MERLKFIAQKSEDNRTQLQNTNSTNELSKESATEKQSYLDQVALIVRDACYAAGQTGVTTAEKLAMAKVWSKMLFDEIPLKDLQNAFDLAVKKHQSNFMINAYDLKNAYQEIVIEREKQKQESLKKDRCPYYNHDPKTGMMKVVNPFNFHEDITLPCAYCRPSEYYEARSEFINTSGEINPLDILNNLVSEKVN
jgi:hypothetical protein